MSTNSSSSSSSSSTISATIHPAVTVNNIKNYIPIVLGMEDAHYTSWVELFKIHCRAYQVIDHIISPPSESSVKPGVDWDRLDAIVLQWIYGTISSDLLLTIITPNSTAAQAWQALEHLFIDSKPSRALYLENKFSNTKLDSFPSISAYCQALKMIADQLANVDAPVSNQRLVLQLIGGLNAQYEGIATVLQQTKPLPDFYTARSQLILEETRKQHQSTSTALLSTNPKPLEPLPPPQTQSQPAYDKHQQRQWGSGHIDNSNRGRVGRGRGRGRGRSRGRGHYGQFRPFSQSQQPPWANSQQWSWSSPTWNTPPCPYPTAPATRPPSRSPGILGAAPSQAYASSDNAYMPTNIEQALHTMTLNPDQSWYLDTGATNHMSNTTGKLSSYVNNSIMNHIVVGNGFKIPILGTGSTTLKPPFPPLQLNNILLAPHLIKNLLSVRRLTTDNMISIEFDPFGFLVKDYQTRIPILRCNSTGDLYPLSLPAAQFTTPTTFAALSQDLWHRRLGHPGSSLLRVLNKEHSISVAKVFDKRLCQSCVFGKHTRLPFYDSLSTTSLPFDILHSDLWTSPILSSGGHRYYILFLDDFTNFLWTYPLSNKSNVFQIFLNFHKMIKTQFERDIKTFQCDNGTEYNNTSFHSFCAQNGMLFRFSCPHTSSQNGKAERKIRSINNIIRTLLTQSSVPPTFWHHALQMATYLLNILPSKIKGHQTPTYLLYHKRPTYTHLRTFGCLCYPLISSNTINKLHNRSSPCVFLGYPSNHRGYKCYDLSSHKLFISRHVLFDEQAYILIFGPPFHHRCHPLGRAISNPPHPTQPHLSPLLTLPKSPSSNHPLNP
ncbi:hypothetical protein E3N88_09120 [Mikania micrantha]|uniref:Integrase catalytic domain-containing protein n=1 Tax=Mikania micrantha TaxID=192012 RepID=A0A5N6PI82_9ASTR|nr:hypothetical protein E3N88_09120 [Mikania micrantha]